MTEDEVEEAVRELLAGHLLDYEYLNTSEYVTENYPDFQDNDIDTVFDRVRARLNILHASI